MTALSRQRGGRLLAAAHLAQAIVLLIQPSGVLQRVAGDQAVPPAWIMRVLGARLLVQGATEALSPSPATLRISAFVDVAHAASMLAASRMWPRYRRAALVSAGSAATSALASGLLVRARASTH